MHQLLRAPSYLLFVCRDGSEHILVGLFATPEQAAQEYDQAALDMHGTEAFTNFASGSCNDLGLTGQQNKLLAERPSPTVSLTAASGQCTRWCIKLSFNDACPSVRCTARGGSNLAFGAAHVAASLTLLMAWAMRRCRCH